MKQVYLAEDPVEAHIVVELLKAEGIAATVQGEHLFAIRGVVPLDYPTVWVVDEDDYERARELALEYDRGRYTAQEGGAPPPQPWICPQCGERIEGQFGLCWQCGAERPVEEEA